MLPLSPGPGSAGLLALCLAAQTGEPVDLFWANTHGRGSPSGAFDDARPPARPAGRSRSNSIVASRLPVVARVQRQRADIGVYDRYRFVVTVSPHRVRRLHRSRRDPGTRLSPPGVHPRESGRGRGSAAVVAGPWFRRPSRSLSRRSDWRTRRSVLGEYPWPRIAQRAFDNARPARRGGRGRIRPSSRFAASDLRSCTARQCADIGVYDRYRFVVTSRRIVYDGCIVRVVLLVHVRYVALLVNVGGVPSVSMMISPVHLARVEMRTVPCSVCRDLYGCGSCPSWCIVR